MVKVAMQCFSTQFKQEYKSVFQHREAKSMKAVTLKKHVITDAN